MEKERNRLNPDDIEGSETVCGSCGAKFTEGNPIELWEEAVYYRHNGTAVYYNVPFCRECVENNPKEFMLD